MTSGRGADDSLDIPELAEIDPSLGDREAQKWIGQHLTELRKSVSERRIRNQTLWLVLVIGLVGYVVGYWLRVSVSGEPWGFLADLLYTLGFALWTGVVVVVVVEIIPLAKERQITRALDAYEAAVRAKAAPPSSTMSSEEPPSPR